MSAPVRPSAVIAAIVSRLQAALPDEAVEVRAHDGEFLLTGGKDGLTVRSPGILVACLGFPSVMPRDFEPPAARAHFVAVCHARTAKPDDDQATAGDVAMDLAAMVMGIVQNEIWKDGDGNPVVCARAEKISASNELDEKVKAKGIRVWCVQWLQGIEMPAHADVMDSLNRLAAINLLFEMGDEDTPDQEALQEFPE